MEASTASAHARATAASQAKLIAAGDRAALARFYETRAAAVLAYCSRLCRPQLIVAAVDAAFAGLFEAVGSGEVSDDVALDARLRSAVRRAAAERPADPPPEPPDLAAPVLRLLERRGDGGLASACTLMPELLVARAEGAIGARDDQRMRNHMRRCGSCRTLEQRFGEAERAFDALLPVGGGSTGRSVARATASAAAPAADADAPADAVERLFDGVERGERLRAHDRRGTVDSEPELEVEEFGGEPPVESSAATEDADELPVGPEEFDAGETEAATEREADSPLAVEAQPADLAPAIVERPREAAATLAPTEAPPPAAPRRRPGIVRRRLAAFLFVVGVLLLAEMAVTLIWKEPLTAYLAARSQDSLRGDLTRLDRAAPALAAGERRSLAMQRGADARIALLAAALQAHTPAGRALGRMSVPRIGIDFVFVQGTDATSLRKGPGHYAFRGAVLPGEGGVVGIAGHRTTYLAPFRDIDALRRGDRIVLTMPYGRFTYAVAGQRIVPGSARYDFHSGRPADGRLRAGPGAPPESLVLSACHPLYSASQRILLTATLVARVPLGAATGLPAPRVSATAAQRRTAAQLRALGDAVLALGATGPNVRALQHLLGVPESGNFGYQTASAVRDFESAHGLPVSGIAGPRVKALLARRQSPPLTPPTPPTPAPVTKRATTSGASSTSPYRPTGGVGAPVTSGR